MPDQLSLPELPEFTGLPPAEYLDRLIDLAVRCAVMEPRQYKQELNHLNNLRRIPL